MSTHQVLGACPLDCPDTCSWIVTVEDGRAVKGQWPRLVKGGATVNATVDERVSDMGGGAVFHDNRVEIERLAGS